MSHHYQPKTLQILHLSGKAQRGTNDSITCVTPLLEKKKKLEIARTSLCSQCYLCTYNYLLQCIRLCNILHLQLQNVQTILRSAWIYAHIILRTKKSWPRAHSHSDIQPFKMVTDHHEAYLTRVLLLYAMT